MCVSAFALTKGARDMLGWISCSTSKGDAFKKLRAAHGVILNSCTDIVHVWVCAFVSIYVHTYILSHFSQSYLNNIHLIHTYIVFCCCCCCFCDSEATE